MSCRMCWDDLCDENKVFVDGIVYDYCFECVKLLLDTQFDQYISSIKATCKGDRENLIRIGPPIWLRDCGKEVKEFFHKGVNYSGIVKSSLEFGNLQKFSADIRTCEGKWEEVLEKYGFM